MKLSMLLKGKFKKDKYGGYDYHTPITINEHKIADKICRIIKDNGATTKIYGITKTSLIEGKYEYYIMGDYRVIHRRKL